MLMSCFALKLTQMILRRDWKYKNVELGDDPFSTSNRYADDIKEKSQQVKANFRTILRTFPFL